MIVDFLCYQIDKPALPFPDISEQVEDATEEDLKRWETLTETERTVATKWAEVSQRAPSLSVMCGYADASSVSS